MEKLRLDVQILTYPIRLSEPCWVKVRLTNQHDKRVQVNRRLAVGYRDSDARELFAEVFNRDSNKIISKEALLYERNSSTSEDIVWLAPTETVTTTFNLFEWYELQSIGEYELVVSYQPDVPFKDEPGEAHAEVLSSDRVALSVVA